LGMQGGAGRKAQQPGEPKDGGAAGGDNRGKVAGSHGKWLGWESHKLPRT
jgi:hypothetical protein